MKVKLKDYKEAKYFVNIEVKSRANEEFNSFHNKPFRRLLGDDLRGRDHIVTVDVFLDTDFFHQWRFMQRDSLEMVDNLAMMLKQRLCIITVELSQERAV